MLFAAILDRRRRAEQKASDRAASDEDFWSKPAPPAPPPAAQRSDIRTKTVAETNRPLDKKAREARQKRYAEKDQKLFRYWVATRYDSCAIGDIGVNVDKSLGEAAPTVTWDGARLKGAAKDSETLVRHEFRFDVSLGDHTLDVTLAGSRPISRHERVRCHDEEKTRLCLGGPCPRYRACECRTVE